MLISIQHSNIRLRHHQEVTVQTKKDGKNITPTILLNFIKQTFMCNMFAENFVNPEN